MPPTDWEKESTGASLGTAAGQGATFSVQSAGSSSGGTSGTSGSSGSGSGSSSGSSGRHARSDYGYLGGGQIILKRTDFKCQQSAGRSASAAIE